jgi:hypothetical protein
MIRRSIIVALSAAIFGSSCDTPQSPFSDHKPVPFPETNTGPAPDQETFATPPVSATEDTISPVHRLSPTEVPGTGVFLNSGNQRPVA